MSEPAKAAPSAPPRVAYILKMFPRLSETFILNEVLELERQGLPLHLFSLRRPVDSVVHEQARCVRSPITYVPERPMQAPLQLARAQWHAWRRYRQAWRHMLHNAIRHLRSSGDSADLLAFCQACCVARELGVTRHLHAHYANLPAKVALLVHRLTGASYSITTHAKDIFQNDPFASPKLQERMCQASFVIANSQFSAQHIRTRMNGQADVRIVHNGLDLEAFPRRAAEPQQPLILGVGRLVEKKGFADLIVACQLLRQKGLEFSCEIVGTGALSLSLKEQIKTLRLNHCVSMTGPLPQQVLREHYARATVFALPCKRANDGDRDILPNVLKEAMAVGAPVLTTRLEGIEELIEDGVTGLLVEPGDVTALAGKLELLLRDAQLRRALAEQARQLVESRFDRRANVARLKDFLDAAVHDSAFQTLESQATMPETYGTSCVR